MCCDWTHVSLHAANTGSPVQPGHGKVSFRQRAADESAAAAAAGSSAVPPPPVHATVGGLGKVHPYSSPSKAAQQQRQQQHPADSGADDQQQQATTQEGAEAAAAAAGASGRSLGPSQAAGAAAAAAEAAGGDAPRVKGSGPQLDMLTGLLCLVGCGLSVRLMCVSCFVFSHCLAVTACVCCVQKATGALQAWAAQG